MSKKGRRNQRRQQKRDYELTSEAKNSWERLRKHQLPNSERKKLMEEVLTAISGQVYQVHNLRFIKWPYHSPSLHCSLCEVDPLLLNLLLPPFLTVGVILVILY